MQIGCCGYRMPVVGGVAVSVPVMHCVIAVKRRRKERLTQHSSIQHTSTQHSAGSSSRMVVERERRIERKSLLKRS